MYLIEPEITSQVQGFSDIFSQGETNELKIQAFSFWKQILMKFQLAFLFSLGPKNPSTY